MPLAAALALFLLPIIMTAGCASRGVAKTTQGGVTAPVVTGADLSRVERVAVLDFYEGRHPDMPGTAYVCHLTGASFVQGEVVAGAGEVVAEQFRERLAELGLPEVNRSTLDTAMADVDEKTRDAYNIELAKALGERVGAEVVVMGSVMRFEERSGTKYGSDAPASVAFCVAFIDVKTGGMLWKAKFEKTQKALFDNVLDYKTFFKGGMVWQKASQLSAIGVRNTLDEAPGLKKRP